MKAKGTEYSNWDDIKEDEILEKDLPRHQKSGKKWYELIPFSDIKGLLPVLRYIHGAKERITFNGFKITAENNNTIFERNKHFFTSQSQVDRVAWYIGSKMLEIIYSKHGGLKSTKLADYLESQEEKYRIYDQFKIVKDTFKKLVEKHYEGYVTDEELNQHAEDLLKTFDGENKAKAARIIDELLSETEAQRISNRVKKRVVRDWEKKVRGIEKVPDL